MRRPFGLQLCSACCCLALLAPRLLHAQEPAAFPPEDLEFFEKHVRPLLVERCFECHSSPPFEGGLQLVSREALLLGGSSGPAIVPGKPDDSLLIRAVGYLAEPQMPPDGKLDDAQIDLLRQWVARGAPWPDEDAPLAPLAAAARGWSPSPAQQSWWAFQPVREPPVPAVRQTDWPRNDLDRFILAELEAQGLAPAPPADQRTWLRRVTFDLAGLPPTPEEMDAFLADESPPAREQVVDRLLAAPTYGQAWARHWLDVARYADYYDANPAARVASCELTEAWRYRDWVVEAFNADLPYDQFIVHQIAGDLLPSPAGEAVYPAGLIATTFLANGVWDRGDADKEKIVSDMVDDNIDVIGKAFLGLTLGCARCHDHKFDPVSTEDYYALAGIFYSSHILKELGAKGGEYTLNRVPLVPAEVVAARDAQLQEVRQIDARLAELDAQSPPAAADDPERVALVARRGQIHQALPPEPPLAMAIQEGGTAGGLFPGIQDVPIHIRGSYANLGPVVPRRLPRFFAGESQPPLIHGSGRRELAQWVASADNPLTARVIVNRLWHWHFGAGLVRTSSNFGLLSQPPSHPALLDWLAARFVADGWSLKKLHRQIVLSATYGQASAVAPTALAADPDNRWLGRFRPRRLEAEAIRDAVLFVNGRLDLTLGGPAADDITTARRSLYVQTARWDRGSFAILFDAANPDATVEARDTSTVTPQALFLLNHPFAHEQARYLAERLLRDVPDGPPDAALRRIDRVYRLLFGRPPTAEEQAIAQTLVPQSPADPDADLAAWTDLAHVLLCSNELVYVD